MIACWPRYEQARVRTISQAGLGGVRPAEKAMTGVPSAKAEPAGLLGQRDGRHYLISELRCQVGMAEVLAAMRIMPSILEGYFLQIR